MLRTIEERILDVVRGSKEAVTYGEVLGKCVNGAPYFASLATKTCLESKDISSLDIFFKSSQEETKRLCNFYLFEFTPKISKLECNGDIKHVNTNKKRYAPHTNLVYDDDEKLSRRLVTELKRKEFINPVIGSIANDLANKISETFPEESFNAFLVGSSSPKSGKMFIYYGDKERIRAVSDLDIELLYFGRGGGMKIGKIRNYLDEVSKKKMLPINVFINNGSNKKLNMKRAVPLVLRV